LARKNGGRHVATAALSVGRKRPRSAKRRRHARRSRRGPILLADRGSDGDALTARLAKQGAWGNIKPMPHRVNVPSFSRYLYRFRNLVECFFNKLKHFRAVATRYEKHDANYLALVKLAAIRIWFRFMSR
jgi:transposase